MSQGVRVRLLLGWPLSRLSYPLAALTIASAVIISTRPLLRGPYVTWSTASAAWHETLAIPITVAVGMSVWFGSSLHQRRSALAEGVRSRVGASATIAHLTGLVVWSSFGLVVGMVPVTIHALLTATWGSLRLADVLTALAGTASLVSAAYVIGVVTRTTLAAPVAALIAFVLVNLPGNPQLRPLALVQPVQQWTAGERDIPNLAATAFSMLTAIAVVVASIAAADARLRPRGPRRGHVALVVTPLLLIAVAFAWRPHLYVDSGERPAVCGQTTSESVCLHQAHQRSLQLAVDTIRALESAGAQSMLGPTYDDALGAPDTKQPVQTLRIEPGLTVPIADQIAEQISAASQSATCLDPDDQETIRTYDLAGLIRARLLREAGFAHVADSVVFTSGPDVAAEREVIEMMSSGRFEQFVTENAEAITSCTLTSDAFGVS